jgi:hypothetical protein
MQQDDWVLRATDVPVGSSVILFNPTGPVSPGDVWMLVGIWDDLARFGQVGREDLFFPKERRIIGGVVRRGP